MESSLLAVCGLMLCGAAYALGRRRGRDAGWLQGWRDGCSSPSRETSYQLGRAEGFHEGWAERGHRFHAVLGKENRN